MRTTWNWPWGIQCWTSSCEVVVIPLSGSYDYSQDNFCSREHVCVRVSQSLSIDCCQVPSWSTWCQNRVKLRYDGSYIVVVVNWVNTTHINIIERAIRDWWCFAHILCSKQEGVVVPGLLNATRTISLENSRNSCSDALEFLKNIFVLFILFRSETTSSLSALYASSGQWEVSLSINHSVHDIGLAGANIEI